MSSEQLSQSVPPADVSPVVVESQESKPTEGVKDAAEDLVHTTEGAVLGTESVKDVKDAAKGLVGAIFSGFYNPHHGGGVCLNHDVNSKLGEPLNVIISSHSSPDVLSDEGFMRYMKSLGFSKEFMGLHLGDAQTADLGDGNGHMPQVLELRQNYGNSLLGTGIETLVGGNHLRMYRQNGVKANSGALFLAVSVEENIHKHHTISPNGYNLGRDKLVARALAGPTHYHEYTYHTTSQDVTDLIPAGIAGINHAIEQDGIVKLLTVTVQKKEGHHLHM